MVHSTHFECTQELLTQATRKLTNQLIALVYCIQQRKTPAVSRVDFIFKFIERIVGFFAAVFKAIDCVRVCCRQNKYQVY